MLVRILKNWNYPDLMRQTPGGRGVWDDVQFTLDDVEKCDFLIILNDLRGELKVECPPENVWAVFQEPYVQGFAPWMRYEHQQFARVYSCRAPRIDSKYRLFHPMVPWHVEKSYDDLFSLKCPEKKDEICWVTSDLAVLPGHKLRHAFYRYLQSVSMPGLTIWGRGIRPVANKWDVLAPAKYAIAVENFSGFHYWTEKVADCWLAYSLPFYYGCLNLEDYFPPEAFIRIDLNDFASAESLIMRSCEQGEYEKRYPAICEARRLVLGQRQFFPTLVREMKKAANAEHQRKKIKLKPFHMSMITALKEKFFRQQTIRRPMN